MKRDRRMGIGMAGPGSYQCKEEGEKNCKGSSLKEG